jgi:hypothetical protein
VSSAVPGGQISIFPFFAKRGRNRQARDIVHENMAIGSRIDRRRIGNLETQERQNVRTRQPASQRVEAVFLGESSILSIPNAAPRHIDAQNGKIEI